MKKEFSVNVQPDMGMYRIMQSLPYDAKFALCEFIDNSLQSYLEQKSSIQCIDKTFNKLNIDICVDTEKDEIIILDNAGGISRNNFQQAIQPGKGNRQYAKDSLSAFGIGLKSSAIYLSKEWILETSALNSLEKISFEFNLDKLIQENTNKVRASYEKTEREKHYTKITLKKIYSTLNEKEYEEKIIPHIIETYSKFKNDIIFNFIYNDQKIKSPKWFEVYENLSYPQMGKNKSILDGKYKTWKEKVDIQYKGSKVTGFFILTKKGRQNQPGLRLFRNRRLIQGTTLKPNRPELIFGRGNNFITQRLYGEIHLNDFKIDFMKMEFDRDILNNLYKVLHERLEEKYFLKQAKYYRSRKADELLKGNTQVIVAKKKGKIIKKINTPKIEKKSNRIERSEIIEELLLSLDGEKLSDLYKSLCNISLQDHSYLMYVGAWSFFENLSSLLHENDTSNKPDFPNFFKSKMDSWKEFKNKREDKKDIKNTLDDISIKGNSVKHNAAREFENAMQLKKDFKFLEKFIIYCLKKIENKESDKV